MAVGGAHDETEEEGAGGGVTAEEGIGDEGFAGLIGEVEGEAEGEGEGFEDVATEAEGGGGVLGGACGVVAGGLQDGGCIERGEGGGGGGFEGRGEGLALGDGVDPAGEEFGGVVDAGIAMGEGGLGAGGGDAELEGV